MVRFFASFSGLSHPWTPTEPLYFDEIHSRQTYYRAWYSEVRETPRLDRLQKFYILYDELISEESTREANKNCYHSIIKTGNGWRIGEAITAQKALDRTHYAFFSGVKGHTEHAQHVFATVIEDISYYYNNGGALIHKKIDLWDIPSSMEP